MKAVLSGRAVRTGIPWRLDIIGMFVYMVIPLLVLTIMVGMLVLAIR
jgi:hypothetical protein